MFLAGLRASLDQITQVQAHLSASLAVTMAIVGIGAAWVPGVWNVLWPISTMAHEGAHAVMGSAFGHKITGMELKLNGGATAAQGAEGTLSSLPVTFAGYLGPSAFGIGAAELIRHGHIVAVLWIGLLCLLLVLFLARKSFGVILVIVALVALLLLLGRGSLGTQVVTAYGVTWFLLGSGLRVLDIRRTDSADAGALKEMTGLPAGFWLPLWLAGTVAALLFGAKLLI